MATRHVWAFRLCASTACFLFNVLHAIHRCSIANEAVRGGLDCYLVFLLVFCFRCFGGYRRLASATLMTLIDICCSLGFKFATFVAASALVGNQCGTVNCPHLVGSAACAGRS
jgi:hypothetical protein